MLPVLHLYLRNVTFELEMPERMFFVRDPCTCKFRLSCWSSQSVLYVPLCATLVLIRFGLRGRAAKVHFACYTCTVATFELALPEWTTLQHNKE